MPTTACEYRLRIPSETDNLELIREFVTKVADKVGFNSDDVGKIELACDEACTNVIRHAYTSDQNNGTKSLDIMIKIDFDKFTLIVTDHGKGFDPDFVKIPDMQEYTRGSRIRLKWSSISSIKRTLALIREKCKIGPKVTITGIHS